MVLSIELHDDEKQGVISNILEENVLQPLLVSTSAIELATETVGLLLRIDDYHPSTSFCLGLTRCVRLADVICR